MVLLNVCVIDDPTVEETDIDAVDTRLSTSTITSRQGVTDLDLISEKVV